MADSIDDLQAKLDDLLARLEKATPMLSAAAEESQKATAAVLDLQEEYDLKLSEARKIQEAARNEQYAIQRSINDAKYEASRLQSQIEATKRAEEEAKREAERLARLEEQNATLTKRFDLATIGAKWREWAKDHQIQAAHKIVQDRYVILADPMGLGKTLSSIITVEMAERVTTDVSEEFPFLGEEKEFHTAETWTHKESGQKYVGWKPADVHNNPDDYEHTPAGTETKIVNAITRPVGRRVLYICPNALIRNVRDEWRMWAPHRNVTFLSNMTKEERKFNLDFLPKVDNYVVVVNFEAWRRDWPLVESLAAMKFDTVIIDEAHNIKDRKTNAWKGVAALIGLDSDFPHRPEYVIPMTGTPVLNKPQELFTLLNLVKPQDFYHENDFLYEYCQQNYNTDKWEFKPGGLDRLTKRLNNCFLRRTRDQAGIILPEKTIIHHDLDVDAKTYERQAWAREQMRKHAMLVIENSVDEYGNPKALAATVVIALYTRLRQIETWPAGIIQRDKHTGEIKFQLDVEESQKIDYIISKDGEDGLIPEVVSDERVVVFSQFKAPLHELKSRIENAGYRAVVLDGDTPETLKEEIRKDFDRRHTPDRSKSKWDVVLCNYRVGGVGLNLTAATQMIIVDSEWSPGKRDQAFDRIHRIGQEEAVTIHVVSMKKTIDDWLNELMEAKDNMVDGFNNAVTSGKSLKNALESGLI